MTNPFSTRRLALVAGIAAFVALLLAVRPTDPVWPSMTGGGATLTDPVPPGSGPTPLLSPPFRAPQAHLIRPQLHARHPTLPALRQLRDGSWMREPAPLPPGAHALDDAHVWWVPPGTTVLSPLNGQVVASTGPSRHGLRIAQCLETGCVDVVLLGSASWGVREGAWVRAGEPIGTSGTVALPDPVPGLALVVRHRRQDRWTPVDPFGVHSGDPSHAEDPSPILWSFDATALGRFTPWQVQHRLARIAHGSAPPAPAPRALPPIPPPDEALVHRPLTAAPFCDARGHLVSPMRPAGPDGVPRDRMGRPQPVAHRDTMAEFANAWWVPRGTPVHAPLDARVMGVFSVDDPTLGLPPDLTVQAVALRSTRDRRKPRTGPMTVTVLAFVGPTRVEKGDRVTAGDVLGFAEGHLPWSHPDARLTLRHRLADHHDVDPFGVWDGDGDTWSPWRHPGSAFAFDAGPWSAWSPRDPTLRALRAADPVWEPVFDTLCAPHSPLDP